MTTRMLWILWCCLAPDHCAPFQCHTLPMSPTGTAQHHYGHFCTLVGKHVNSEVFPHIEAFISEFDTPDTGMLQGQPGPPLPVPAAVVPVAER